MKTLIITPDVGCWRVFYNSEQLAVITRNGKSEFLVSAVNNISSNYLASNYIDCLEYIIEIIKVVENE